jgi:hypothetical protein
MRFQPKLVTFHFFPLILLPSIWLFSLCLNILFGLVELIICGERFLKDFEHFLFKLFLFLFYFVYLLPNLFFDLLKSKLIRNYMSCAFIRIALFVVLDDFFIKTLFYLYYFAFMILNLLTASVLLHKLTSSWKLFLIGLLILVNRSLTLTRSSKKTYILIRGVSLSRTCRYPTSTLLFVGGVLSVVVIVSIRVLSLRTEVRRFTFEFRFYYFVYCLLEFEFAKTINFHLSLVLQNLNGGKESLVREIVQFPKLIN